MAEMIIPGTYIEVRDEGLISAGRIAAGIVGIVGTAESGPVDEPVTLSSMANAREAFGSPDDYNQPLDNANPLTLVRALDYLYGNGASTVLAVRVAGASKKQATFAVPDASGNTVTILKARTPGTWGNNIRFKTETAKTNAFIERELHENSFTQLDYGGIAERPRNQIRVYRGATKEWKTLNIAYQSGANAVAAKPGEAVIIVSTGALGFAQGEEPQKNQGDKLEASYEVDQSKCVQVSLTYGATGESYTVPDGRWLTKQINRSKQGSKLVEATVNATHGNKLPKSEMEAYCGTGANDSGNNGAEAAQEEYTGGLRVLEDQLVHIVVLAGQDVERRGADLLKHLKATEQTDHERIAVIGANGNQFNDFLKLSQSDGRLIVVAPGLVEKNGTITELPPAYAAAAVAGLISSVPVQTSLTNKPLILPGLQDEFNRGEQEQLIKSNILAIVKKENGRRILKGITTAGEGTPYSSIPTRRIVDKAKYGVRSAANPYLGRLNNSRVRAALKATLDGLLTRMVDQEELTKYELEVSATRPQEIAGEVSVVMTLQPTFSIDFIRVVMNLK